MLGCGGRLSGGGGLGEQFANGLGETSALAGPIVNAIALEIDACGGGAGIVGAYNFYGTAVAGTVLFDHNDAVMGLFARSNTRQTNHQHK